MAANPNYKKLRLPQLKKGQSPLEVQNKIKTFTDFVNSGNPSPVIVMRLPPPADDLDGEIALIIAGVRNQCPRTAGA